VAIAETISVLGVEKTRIINTHGDFAAPPWSIGSYDATRSLKVEFPTITSLLLTPKASGSLHIEWMVNPHGAFDITETVLDANGTATLSLGTFSPVQFRDETTFQTAHSRAMAGRQASPVAPSDDVADALDRLAGYVVALKDFVEAVAKLKDKSDLLPPGLSLIPATLRDEADKIRFGDRTWLASHKIDAIASECLSRLEDVMSPMNSLPQEFSPGRTSSSAESTVPP
jgi:hypothetical protein